MKRRMLLLATLALTLAIPAGARGQGDDVEERGWITARPQQRAPTRRRPSPQTAAGPTAAGATAKKRPEGAKPETAAVGGTPAAGTALKPVAVGVGYWLYRKGADGRVVTVSPSDTFHDGDLLRIVVEPNVDGYLYVFDAENDKNPILIYPDARLDQGDNRVQAHEAIEVPSSEHPTFNWFRFRGAPAVDRLYLVVTREPLPGVPSGDEMVKYCAAYKNACPWRPGDAQWNAILELARVPVKLTATSRVGRAQSDSDQGVLKRELTLSSDDPPPTVVGVSESVAAGAVVVNVDLKHE